jgi:HlyD family secretion protein
MKHLEFMRANRKSLAIAGAALGALALIWWSFSGNGASLAYRTQALAKGEIVASVSSSGTLAAEITVQVGSQLSGQMQEVIADYNAEVKAGEVIARMDPATFETKVAQAVADLEVAKAAVMIQEASLDRARADVVNARAGLLSGQAETTKSEVILGDARRDMERKKALAKDGVVSAADRDKAQAAVDSAAASLRSSGAQSLSKQAAIDAAAAAVKMSEAQVINAKATVAQREAALRQAQVDLERTIIRAPVDGTVILRNVEPGQTVASSLQSPILFTIAQNLSRMQVETSVDEADVGRVSEGQEASFTVDALPGRVFSGKVRQVRKAAQVVQNVVTYTVVVTAENPDKRLLPGMTANVRIITDRRDNVLKIPNAALRFRPPDAEPISANKQRGGKGKSAMEGRVYLMDNGRPKAITVRLGIGDGQFVELLEGELKEGQKLIVGAEGAGAAPAKPPSAPRMGF